MTNKKVTLSIDSGTYDRFKDFCDRNAIMLSKKIELFMRNELDAADSQHNASSSSSKKKGVGK